MARRGNLDGLSTDGAVVSGLLDREELLEKLDRAVTRRITVISAPPGSGKTSLLRAWADRVSPGSADQAAPAQACGRDR